MDFADIIEVDELEFERQYSHPVDFNQFVRFEGPIVERMGSLFWIVPEPKCPIDETENNYGLISNQDDEIFFDTGLESLLSSGKDVQTER